ncbi:MAG: alpha/beta hydrolase [Deltaproteobacteria bacterium]|nr:MAG: alpha/beta hydrolase [Deltaproteobacteria bacterium]
MTAIIFIHGLESSNQGTKSVFFRERFPDMMLPNFTGSLDVRMQKLDRLLKGKTDIRMVGSSFGGLMAAIFTMRNEFRVDRLVLLAPALNLLGHSVRDIRKIGVPVSLYHGTNDRVIPVDKVRAVARDLFSDLAFHEVEDDHFLHHTFKTIPWERLLKTSDTG